jgi:hypothetical protein
MLAYVWKVDLTKLLLSKFKLRRRIRRITYEGLHLICFQCGQYGHKKETCPCGEQHEDLRNGSTESEQVHGKADASQLVGNQDMESVIRSEVKEPHGQWMAVRKTRKFGKRVKL